MVDFCMDTEQVKKNTVLNRGLSYFYYNIKFLFIWSYLKDMIYIEIVSQSTHSFTC